MGVYNPDSALTLDAQLMVETSAPGQLQWPENCQINSPTSASCSLASIAPQESRLLDLPAVEQFWGSDAPVSVQALPMDIMELQPSDNHVTIPMAGVVSGVVLPDNDDQAFVPVNDLASDEGVELTAANPSAGVPAATMLSMLGIVLLLRRQKRLRTMG